MWIAVSRSNDYSLSKNQLLEALPRMAKAASAPQLETAFQEQPEVTKGQVTRLEKIFEGLGASPKGKKCKAMEGLVEEGKADKKLTQLAETVINIKPEGAEANGKKPSMPTKKPTANKQPTASKAKK